MSTKDICGSLHKIPFENPSPTIDLNNIFLARLMLLKRNAFKFENEIRIIIVKDKITKDISGVYF